MKKNMSVFIKGLLQNGILLLLALFLSIIIFIIDLSAPKVLAVGALYSIIVLYSWLLPLKHSSIYIACLCTVLLIIAGLDTDGHITSGDHVPGINRIVSFVVIWICASLVTIAKHSFEGLENAKDKLEEKVQKRTSQLKGSEVRLRQMTETIQDYAIFLIDTDGTIENWNHGAQRMNGYDSMEAIGNNFEIFFIHSDRMKHKPRQLIDTANNLGRSRDEGWRIRKDGSAFWGGITITAIYDENIKITGFSIIMHDLTSRKQAEEAVSKSEQQMRSLLESATDAIITADQYGNILNWNKAAENIFGWKFEEVKNKEMTIIMPEKYRLRHSQGLKRYRETGKDNILNQTMELEGLHKNGTIFPAEISIGSWKVDGQYYFCGIIRDIRERKQAEKAVQLYNEQLEAQNRELEQFAYIASHDLQEPLRTVKNYSLLLERKYHKQFDELGHVSLRFIIDATERMSKLVKGLLDYSRIGKNRKMSEVDCNNILNTVLDDLSSMIEETKAEIEIDQLPQVKGNPTEFRMLFQNLLTNAIKFRKKKSIPKVRIWSEEEGGQVKFLVKDSGIGIKEEHKERVFVIFQRLQSDDDYKGTGIGLAHCRKIVESYGGKIWVNSKPQLGSTFQFTIPYKEVE